MPKKEPQPTSIRLDPETKSALEELAVADDRSVSSYIRRVLEAHVASMRKRKAR